MAVSHSGGVGHSVSNESLSNSPVLRKRSYGLSCDDCMRFGLGNDEYEWLTGLAD
jgi:hypothetical protein